MKKTILALIGRGKWGKNYLEAVKGIENCQIKYVRTRDYKTLLKHKDIDGIIIATPSHTHSEVIKCFPKHYLLVEKPLTTDLEEALKIKNKKIMVGHIYLYNANFLKQIKDIGRINFLSFKLYNTNSFSKGAHSLIPLWELIPHAISLCITFLKAPIKVIYSCRTIDRHIVVLSHKYGLCTIEVGYDYKKKFREIVVAGNTDVLVFDDSKKNKVSPLETELRAFVDFIHGKPTKTGLEHSIKTMRILDKIDKCMM